ncbi:DUF2972 domain-containing protein [Campylobacter insulaenigrae]|nr:DUF2972 domain-containing protein [Campylobacter insulaenigrae]MCR6570402.1 DUF2972 domain-containing protein [Campylobacter insulaenigrae]MCR6582716.1 DUF2972 domain-containing protein [Campylobacter insulaenigrae]
MDFQNENINEIDILNFLRLDPSFRAKVKKIFDSELSHIKQHHLDIVASWKYYQEFEKMCEELDGKEDSLKENISND